MVTLVVNGAKVGTLADAESLIPKLTAEQQTIDLVDDSGRTIAVIRPEPLVPWEPGLTRDELDRRANTPGGMKLADFWNQMGRGMSFTVIWRPDSLNQLAELWAESLDRDGLTAASHRIDVALQSDPLGVGESRMENDRILFEPPLAVWYRVNEPSRMVFVLSVGPFGRTG